MLLIHYKDPVHKNHLFANQTTLVALYVLTCYKEPLHIESFVRESDYIGRDSLKRFILEFELLKYKILFQ